MITPPVLREMVVPLGFIRRNWGHGELIPGKGTVRLVRERPEPALAAVPRGGPGIRFTCPKSATGC